MKLTGTERKAVVPQVYHTSKQVCTGSAKHTIYKTEEQISIFTSLFENENTVTKHRKGS